MADQKKTKSAPKIESREFELPPELEAVLEGKAELPLTESAAAFRPSIYEGLLFGGAILVALSLITPWAEVQGKVLSSWQVSKNLSPSSGSSVAGQAWLRGLWLFPVFALLGLFLYRRTKSRLGGLVSSSILAAGAIYLILFFLWHWRFTLSQYFFGSWSMVVGLSFFGLAGIERFRQIESSSLARKILFLAGVLILSGFLLPWMLKSSGLNLLLQLDKASWWAGRSKVWAYGIAVFPLWGLLGIIKGAEAKKSLGPWNIFFLLVGVISLIYFLIFWRPFAGQFVVGLWGTVFGLVLLSFSGLEDYAREKGFLGGLLLTSGFIILSGYLYVLWTGKTIGAIFKALR
jgi:hypothetical protein